MRRQGTVMGDLNKRKGIIMGSEQEGDDTVLQAHVPLASMFGYSTDLRSMTQACPGELPNVHRCTSQPATGL